MLTQPEDRSTSRLRDRAGALLVLGVVATCVGLLAFWAALLGSSRSEAASPERREPLLPRFEGPLLSGEGRAGTSLLSKRRGIVYAFASGDADADAVAGMVAKIAAQADKANIALLGVSLDPDPENARLFAKLHRFDFPIVRDPDQSIAQKLTLKPNHSALIVVDPAGYMVAGFLALESNDARLVEFYQEQLRRALYLPEAANSVVPALGVLPKAPPFAARGLDGKELTLASLRGKVVVCVFFLPTCPHCHEILKFLDRLEQTVANPDLRIVAISVVSQPAQIEKMVEQQGIKLAIYTDPGEKAQTAYAHRHTVPDVIVIDREGSVVGRRSGSQGRTQAVITMEVRDALGIDNPILLDRNGYSGEDTCRVCHRNEHATWSLTDHAYAFETLVKHGADRDPECLPCHSVGWNQPGGYDLGDRAAHLEGVQCENCHGRGGPHQTPGFNAKGFEAVCLGCHNEKHSLHFVFSERLQLVSHSANMQFASLSLPERQALLKRREVRERTLFDKGEFVGSAACQGCHGKEHALWSESAHANALATLRAKQEQSNPACQKCHTTGFGEQGGFPAGGDAVSNVGCESCHGPGANHIKSERKQGSILALTDKCDSCVILQICGSCHDEANDPGFEFELQQKLDVIRHGFRKLETAGQ